MPQVTHFPVYLCHNGCVGPTITWILDENNNLILPSPILAKSVDSEEPIGQTPFQVGQILKWIGQKGDPTWTIMAGGAGKLIDVKVQQVSGIGFLSYIYRVQFFFENVKTPFAVILKVPTIGNLSVFSKDNVFLDNWAYKLSERHNKEIFAYEHFGRRIDLAGVVHVPKIYHAVVAESPAELEKACILMEDLDTLGIMGNTILGMNKNQIEGLIQTIAQIHALSLAVPGSEQLLEQLKFKFTLDEEDGQAKWNAMKAVMGTGHDYWKMHGPMLERIASQNELMLLESHKMFGVPPVLCHGDMWANNVFFERQRDGSAGDALYAIIDWQFSQPNSGLQDIARLVLICANATLKLRHLDDWLILYFDTFSAACRKWGVQCPYTMSLVRQMFLAHYPSEMLFSMMIIMQHFARAENDGLKTALIGRMISSFEWLRQKMKAMETTV